MSALVLATVAGVLGLPAAAFAATVGSGAADGKADVTAVCPAAKSGQATCFALRRNDISSRRGLQPADSTPAGYGPGDLQSAYRLATDGGAGATVAIVDAFDDPNAEADLAVYRQQYGLPACTTANGCFRKVDQRGGTSYPAPDAGWAGEISLDLDMVSAAAPQAHILLVEADSNYNDDLGASVNEAVALGAKYVSNSYGSGYDSTPGSGEDPTEVTQYDQYYNHPGVAVVASSGDGYYGVSYPAASQYVTSVGGTSLVRDGSTRGWSESVWNNSHGGPGSGCSLYEAKPAFQKDTGCDNRTLTDVSAVADPVTGVAVYQTYGASGWAVYGGTSASSPIIASVFADAGTPVAGTYPNSYPYQASSALNDVTTGNNGSCTPAYLCTAGTGYDGPTGLGTPDGVSAFTTGPHGEVQGTVTDTATGAGIAGATVAAGDTQASTDASGGYDLHLPVGSYDLTASGYGYGSSTATGVVVADGATVSKDFALTAVPRATVSGVVSDGSGQGWPLYAKITADGVPGGPVFTDPTTGHYSLSLPTGHSYQLHVVPVYGGYAEQDPTVALGSSAVVQNVAVPVDVTACTAAGYQVHLTGTPQPFDSLPDGWTVSNADGTTGGWGVTDVKSRGNQTGGSGGFAIVDSDAQGSGKHQDSTLTSPVVDMSGYTHPTISFDTDYYGYSNQTGDVDLSTDGGTTWTNIWHHTTNSLRKSHVDIPATAAAGQSTVQVRFHFTSAYGWWWQLDNVLIGNRSCDPVPGGLVLGQVADANTAAGIVGAVVSAVDTPAISTTTVATPDDPEIGDGFYWLYTPSTGSHGYQASKARYTTASATVKVKAQYATEADFTLKAGQVTASPTSISKTLGWGGTGSGTLTLKNTGTAPATVTLAERPSGFTPASTQTGAARTMVKGTYTSHSLLNAAKSAAPAAKAPADVTPAAEPWSAIADYPTPVQDNVVLPVDGKIYSAFGYTGSADSAALYVYDPGAGTWSALASAAHTREKPAAAAIDGKIYASGGWGATGSPDATLEIYDIASNSWSTGAPNPNPLAGSGSAALGGKLYAVGGCTSSCGSTAVEVYDPGTDSWSAAANYPEATAWLSCGAISGELYCAGGTTDAASSKHGYAYDPGANAWSPIADLPADLWGSSYGTADGLLLVSGGVTANSSTLTNQGYAYDPGSNAWTALPNANNTLYRGGGACGFYQVGGNPGGAFVPPVKLSEQLPGYADCSESSDVSWLSLSATSVTLQPGKTAKVTVSLDASAPDVVQPGSFTANVAIGTDTPYPVAAVGVTMIVNPPKTWGKIAGTVTSATDGKPIAGATIQIDTWTASYTLKTDKFGQYQLWLDVRNNPLSVIAAKDGYQPQVRTVKIVKGTTTTSSFVLKQA